jgi:non-ribosomal peptide synthetase component F
MFVFTNKPRTLMEVQDISMSLVEMNSSTEKFGLSLEISEGFQELNCLLSYRTDLFDRSTIERLSRHWLRLLDAMVTEPNRLLSRVELLDEAEKAQIVTEWNDTAVDYPQGQLLHQLFEEQAARSPRATALIFGEEQLTYGELDRRATRLAAYLRTCGVGPDVLVGICMERSVEMAVALLGILKAGGAADPATPGRNPSLQFSADRFDRRGLALDRSFGWGRPGCSNNQRQSRLCYLHVRINGPAAGRDGPSRRRDQLPALDAGDLQTRRDR